MNGEERRSKEEDPEGKGGRGETERFKRSELELGGVNFWGFYIFLITPTAHGSPFYHPQYFSRKFFYAQN